MIIDYLLESLNTTDKYDFQEGDCNIYALALHNKYGYPIYGAKELRGDRLFAHVFVMNPQTKTFIDNEGSYSKEEMMAKFDGTKIVKLSPDAAKLVYFVPESIEMYADDDEIESIKQQQAVKYEKEIDAKIADVTANYLQRE